MRGVILYGPPASGKDTVTHALTCIDPAYVLFPRLKAGPGRTAGYRMTTAEHLDALSATGAILWENERYGARYAVDRNHLMALAQTQTPVLHLGQVQAVGVVLDGTPNLRWIVVELWCPQEVAAGRIAQRRTRDDAERAVAWLETQRLPRANLRLDTSTLSPNEAAARIHESCEVD